MSSNRLADIRHKILINLKHNKGKNDINPVETAINAVLEKLKSSNETNEFTSAKIREQLGISRDKSEAEWEQLQLFEDKKKKETELKVKDTTSTANEATTENNVKGKEVKTEIIPPAESKKKKQGWPEAARKYDFEDRLQQFHFDDDSVPRMPFYKQLRDEITEILKKEYTSPTFHFPTIEANELAKAIDSFFLSKLKLPTGFKKSFFEIFDEQIQKIKWQSDATLKGTFLNTYINAIRDNSLKFADRLVAFKKFIVLKNYNKKIEYNFDETTIDITNFNINKIDDPEMVHLFKMFEAGNILLDPKKVLDERFNAWNYLIADKKKNLHEVKAEGAQVALATAQPKLPVDLNELDNMFAAIHIIADQKAELPKRFDALKRLMIIHNRNDKNPEAKDNEKLEAINVEKFDLTQIAIPELSDIAKTFDAVLRPSVLAAHYIDSLAAHPTANKHVQFIDPFSPFYAELCKNRLAILNAAVLDKIDELRPEMEKKGNKLDAFKQQVYAEIPALHTNDRDLKLKILVSLNGCIQDGNDFNHPNPAKIDIALLGLAIPAPSPEELVFKPTLLHRSGTRHSIQQSRPESVASSHPDQKRPSISVGFSDRNLTREPTRKNLHKGMSTRSIGGDAPDLTRAQSSSQTKPPLGRVNSPKAVTPDAKRKTSTSEVIDEGPGLFKICFKNAVDPNKYHLPISASFGSNKSLVESAKTAARLFLEKNQNIIPDETRLNIEAANAAKDYFRRKTAVAKKPVLDRKVTTARDIELNSFINGYIKFKLAQQKVEEPNYIAALNKINAAARDREIKIDDYKSQYEKQAEELFDKDPKFLAKAKYIEQFILRKVGDTLRQQQTEQKQPMLTREQELLLPITTHDRQKYQAEAEQVYEAQPDFFEQEEYVFSIVRDAISKEKNMPLLEVTFEETITPEAKQKHEANAIERYEKSKAQKELSKSNVSLSSADRSKSVRASSTQSLITSLTEKSGVLKASSEQASADQRRTKIKPLSEKELLADEEGELRDAKTQPAAIQDAKTQQPQITNTETKQGEAKSPASVQPEPNSSRTLKPNRVTFNIIKTSPRQPTSTNNPPPSTDDHTATQQLLGVRPSKNRRATGGYEPSLHRIQGSLSTTLTAEQRSKIFKGKGQIAEEDVEDNTSEQLPGMPGKR